MGRRERRPEIDLALALRTSVWVIDTRDNILAAGLQRTIGYLLYVVEGLLRELDTALAGPEESSSE